MPRAARPQKQDGPSTPSPTRPEPAVGQKVRSFVPLAIDVVVPTVLYFVLQEAGVAPVYALTIAGLATGLAAAVSSIRRRRLDGVGLLVVIEIAVSVGMLLLTRDPRVVLLKPSIYTLVTALYLYGTCLFGRPVVYQAATPMATGGDPVRLSAYHEAWDSSAPFRHRERMVTAAFGTALLLEAVLRVVVVLALPADQIGMALVTGQLPGLVLVVGALLFARSQAPALSAIVDDVQERLMREPAGPLLSASSPAPRGPRSADVR